MLVASLPVHFANVLILRTVRTDINISSRRKYCCFCSRVLEGCLTCADPVSRVAAPRTTHGHSTRRASDRPSSSTASLHFPAPAICRNPSVRRQNRFRQSIICSRWVGRRPGINCWSYIIAELNGERVLEFRVYLALRIN